MEFQGSRQASGRRFAIVVSSFNKEITDGLLHGARAVLSEAGVKDVDVTLVRVPGAFEIPLAARYLAASGRHDAVVCLGCLIKGDTMHFEYIAEAVSHGIMARQRRYRSSRDIRCAHHAHSGTGCGTGRGWTGQQGTRSRARGSGDGHDRSGDRGARSGMMADTERPPVAQMRRRLETSCSRGGAADALSMGSRPRPDR